MHRGIPDHPSSVGTKEGPFQNFNGPKSESVCKVGQLIGKKSGSKRKAREMFCVMFSVGTRAGNNWHPYIAIIVSLILINTNHEKEEVAGPKSSRRRTSLVSDTLRKP